MFRFPRVNDYDPYVRRRCGWLLRSFLFGLLYFGQLAGSVIYLRWLLTDAWNYNSFWTSFFFAWAEGIAFVSTPLRLFSALFPRTMRSPDIEVFFNDLPHDGTGETDLSSKHLMSNDTGTDPTTTRRELSRAVSQDELSMFVLSSECSVDTDSSYESAGAAAKKDISPVISSSSSATVAVCVCRYKEPLADLFRTVQCMKNIESPNNDSHSIQLYILDDGWHSSTDEQKRAQLDGLYRVLGKKINAPDGADDDDLLLPYFSSTQSISRPDCASDCTYLHLQEKTTANGPKPCTLIARHKPETGDCHFKAGNLNNFMYNFLGELAATNQDVPSHLLFLDHDMMTRPDIINDALLSLENDPSLAFVQYPLRFHDLRGCDLFHAGNEVFFDGVQINRGRVGLAAFAGTNAVWNIQALFHVGGLGYNTLTEDTSTGYDVHRLGYTSIYSTKEMVIGASPQTVKVAMQQRMRWSQGAVEILMNSMFSCFKKKPVVPLDEWMCPELARKFSSDMPTKPTFLRRLVIFIVYLDSMIYPFYSFGFLLHVAACALYLATTEAPMAAQDPKAILIYWLPLYGVKYFCQLMAFPSVSMAAQWTSQMAWAGYSLSTFASVLKAVWLRLTKTRSEWFNTGAKPQNIFLLQYGNTLIALLIYLMIVYRAFAFVFVEKACYAWMSIGSISYGFVLLLHVQGWALESIKGIVGSNQRHRPMVPRLARSIDKDVTPDDNDSSTKSLSALATAFSKARKNREQHRALDFSILFVVTNVALFTLILFFWEENNCDVGSFGTEEIRNCDVGSFEPEEIRFSYVSSEIYTPPLSATAQYNVEFVAMDGQLVLGVQNQELKEFKIKGANWFGFETELNVPIGLHETTQDAVMHILVENGFNALRLPLAVGSILSPMDHLVPNEGTTGGGSNPHLNTSSYLDLLESFVDRTASWGVFTLLDMHRLRNDKDNAPYPFDDVTSFDDVKAAWTVLAERFCKSWSVMGADLMNEPYGVTWGDGSSIDWRILAQELAETVLSICPKWLIFIQGQWALDKDVSPLNQTDFGPWGAALTAAYEFPIKISNMSKLVYSPHVYGPATMGESVLWPHKENEAKLLCQCAIRSKVIDDLCTEQNSDHLNVTMLRLEADEYCTQVLPLPHQPFPKNMGNVWDLTFGYLSDLNYTVVVGEWGGKENGAVPLSSSLTSFAGTYVNPLSKNHGQYNDGPDGIREREVLWNHELVAYLGQKGFSSFYWSVNPESQATGGILLSDWRTIDPAKKWLFENLESSNPLSFLGTIIPTDALDWCLDKVGAEQLNEKFGGERYKMESLAYNRAQDSERKRPRSIIFPKSEDQVQQIVLCAKDAKVGVCTRSGGYSYVGESTCNGVLVDLRHMLQLEAVDEELFHVGPGFTLGALAKEMADHGRLIPTGNHGGVGMGWFLGCGHGFLARLYGLGCDNIISARVVTGKGELIEVKDSLDLESLGLGAVSEMPDASSTGASTDNINATIESHSELMWALRGIGSNQLGIVTSIQIQTYPLPPEIRYFRFTWHREMAGKALAMWQDWGLNHPNHALSVRLSLWNPPETPVDFVEWSDGVHLDGVFIGGEEELNALLLPPIDALGDPAVQERSNMTYTKLLSHLFRIPNDDDLQLHVPYVGYGGHRRWFRNLGHLVKTNISKADIDEIVGFVSTVLPRAKPYECFLALYAAGGVSATPQRPTAFGHRDTLSYALYGGFWDSEPSREESVVRHQLQFRNAATKFWGNGAVYNYKDKDLVDWGAAYWGEESVPRLRRLKCRYDPLDLFSTAPQQNIVCRR